MHAMSDDIDPLKHAGEGWYATEEYARPADLGRAHVRAEVGREGEYYPTRGEGDAVYRKKHGRHK